MIDDDKKADESLLEIGVMSAELSNETNKATATQNVSISTIRSRSIVYAKLRKEIKRYERNLHYSRISPDQIDWNTIENPTLNDDLLFQQQKAKELIYGMNKPEERFPYSILAHEQNKKLITSVIHNISEGVDFMKKNNIPVDILLFFCYKTTKVFNRNEKNLKSKCGLIHDPHIGQTLQNFSVIPVDTYDKKEVAKIKKDLKTRKLLQPFFDYFFNDSKTENTFSNIHLNEISETDEIPPLLVYQMRIICQILLGKNISISNEISLSQFNSEDTNWDYGDKVIYKFTHICPLTFRPMLTNIFTKKVIKSTSYYSERLNCHQYFISYLKYCIKNGKLMVKDVVHNRENFLLYLFQRVVPNVKPTLPRSIKEIVDMVLLDYEKVPLIDYYTCKEVVQIAEESMVVNRALEKEKEYRIEIHFIMGDRLMDIFLKIGKLCEEKPDFLDIIMITSFDVIQVPKEYSFCKSQFLPVIDLPKEIFEFTEKELIDFLNKKPKSSYKLNITNTEELEEFQSLSYLEKKVIALSILSGCFISPYELIDPNKYYSRRENKISDIDYIRNNIRKGNYGYRIYCHNNPVVEYVNIYDKLPNTAELIGFLFRRSIPQKRLFLPFTVENVFNNLILFVTNEVKSSRRKDSTTFSVTLHDLIRLSRDCQEKYAEDKLPTLYNPNDDGYLKNEIHEIKDPQIFFTDFILQPQSSIKENCKTQADILIKATASNYLRLSEENMLTIIQKVLLTANFNEDEIILIMKYLFNTVEFEYDNRKFVLPCCGDPVWSERNKSQYIISQDPKKQELFEEFLKMHYLDQQILFLATYVINKKKKNIDNLTDSIMAVKKSQEYKDEDIKYINICPATLYPFVTDKTTWSEFETPPDSSYGDFPVYKIIIDYILDHKDSFQLPTAEEIMYIFYKQNEELFYNHKQKTYLLIHPKAFDICNYVIYSYMKVFNKLNGSIDRSQFLLRTSVCQDRTIRIEFERRYLKKTKHEKHDDDLSTNPTTDITTSNFIYRVEYINGKRHISREKINHNNRDDNSLYSEESV